MTTKVININKLFNDFQALYDIHLEISKGEFIAILGPSGCGKTTLLRLLAGFEKPSSGQIQIDQVVVSTEKKQLPPDQRNVAMVFQSFALWPHLTVREHLAFPLKYDQFTSDIYRKKPERRVEEVLEIVGLKDKGDHFPHELSGGQKQRVALGRAIAPEPQLLLMDEPLSALDAELRLEMRREIQRLHHLTKASIVYVTHDQGEALAMADRIVVMNQGRIEQVGTPEDIYYRPKTVFVAEFVGKANLFKGEWDHDVFKHDQSAAVWGQEFIHESIKGQDYYALRPEQIKLTRSLDNQLTGTVLTKQFQGKEYHYSVNVNGQTILVHCPYSEDFHIGEEVALVPLEVI